MHIVFLVVFLGLVCWLVFSVERNYHKKTEAIRVLGEIKSSLSNSLAYDVLRDKPTITYEDLLTFCTKKALENNVDITLLPYEDKFVIRIQYGEYADRINISTSVVTGFDGTYIKQYISNRPYQGSA